MSSSGSGPSSSTAGRSVLGHAGLSMLGPSSSPQGSARPGSRPTSDTKPSETRPSEERRRSATDMLGEDDDEIPMTSFTTITETKQLASKFATEPDSFLKQVTPSEDDRSTSKRSERSNTDIGPDRYVRRVSGLNGRKLTIDCKISDMLGGKTGDEPDDGSGCLSKSTHPAQETCSPGQVASVWGKATDMDMFQPYFSGKPMNFDNNSMFSVMPHSIGVHCQRGQKPHIPNQDDFFVMERNEWLFFGVLDGHGNEGHQISHYAQERLPSEIVKNLTNKEDWDSSCAAAFKEVVNGLDQKTIARDSGSTASVAILRGGKSPEDPLSLRCAFVGDSSIVYACRPKSGGSWDVCQLGENHKPDRPDERTRIEACGGEVKAPSCPKYPHRLICDSGGLAMSRSLGDLDAVKAGLSNIPEIPPETVLSHDLDHIILICSDGIWDMIDPAAAVQIVAKFQPEDSQRAAEKLAIKAQSRWQEQEREIGVVDDITVILVRPSFVSRTAR